MRLTRTGMSVLLALCVAGCAARGNVELLESRLRVQENQLFAARRDLQSARSELEVARREVETLRTQLAEKQIPAAAPEQLASFSRAESITISRLLSGGLDKDGEPGHDAFNTLITPVDSQGDLAKVPGTVRIELIDLSRNEESRQLGVWEFPPEEAAKHWKTSVFGAGYSFQLPFQEPLTSDKVMLHARLLTTDGRQFDASQELKVSPAPQFARGQEKSRLAVRPEKSASEPSVMRAPVRELRELKPSAAPLQPVPRAVPANVPDESSAVDGPSLERSGFVRLIGEPDHPPLFELPDSDAGDERSAGAPARRIPPSEQLPPAPEHLDLPPAAGSSDPKPAPAAIPAAPAARDVAPLPPGRAVPVTRPIPTSDRWTDETRPVLR